ncbi:5-formyltetrahydrofolate cyclo-ligase [Caballeronia concitans]|uniref:5-formyltetrahydrofolate cyclo-ligase n=1 Tax=Caballeronia concitans TaxID=1777133 RepID=A0A658QT23_9BURK|nr:hypothetical protein BurMR1_1996 [Burkholderia sp. MR1]SAL18155.1 5-formyltetrahydrofolate cyclo-ligase [Caballeronia concitans]
MSPFPIITMKSMKRRNFLLAAAAAPLLLSGCITESLRDEIREGDYRTYTESIDSVLISADGAKLVFLGAKYHYIFDAPAHFAELLDSPLDAKVKVDIRRFNADEHGSVSGTIEMELNDATADEMALAAQLGFRSDGRSSAYRSIYLTGTRYSAKGFDASKVDRKLLRKTYAVEINEPNPLNGRKVLYLLTPVTVAADGALLLLGSPLILVVLIAFSNSHVCCF